MQKSKNDKTQETKLKADTMNDKNKYNYFGRKYILWLIFIIIIGSAIIYFNESSKCYYGKCAPSTEPLATDVANIAPSEPNTPKSEEPTLNPSNPSMDWKEIERNQIPAPEDVTPSAAEENQVSNEPAIQNSEPNGLTKEEGLEVTGSNLESPSVTDTAHSDSANSEANASGVDSNYISPEMLKKIAQYRSYLEAVDEVIINFLQEKPYTAQIDQVRIDELPEKIDMLFMELSNYNENYLVVHEEADSTRVFPPKDSVVENFVVIDQEPKETVQKEKERNKIISKIDDLINFIHSEDLQNIFLSK